MLHLLVTLQVLVTERLDRVRDDHGATAVEYGLMVALIAAGIAAVVLRFRDDILGMFNDTCNAVGTTVTTGGC